MPESVVLRVTQVAVKMPGYTRSIVLEPTADLLYSVEVPDEGVDRVESGAVVFSLAGMRHILKQCHVILVLDSDDEGLVLKPDKNEGDF